MESLAVFFMIFYFYFFMIVFRYIRGRLPRCSEARILLGPWPVFSALIGFNRCRAGVLAFSEALIVSWLLNLAPQ